MNEELINEVELAGISSRFISFIVDYGLLVTFYIALIFLMPTDSDNDFLFLLFFVLLFLPIGYWIYFFGRGQTLGMKLVGIKLCKTDGTYPIGYLGGFVRYIGMCISGAIFYLGFLWILVNKNKQGWHDIISDTYVVKDILPNKADFEKSPKTVEYASEVYKGGTSSKLKLPNGYRDHKTGVFKKIFGWILLLGSCMILGTLPFEFLIQLAEFESSAYLFGVLFVSFIIIVLLIYSGWRWVRDSALWNNRDFVVLITLVTIIGLIIGGLHYEGYIPGHDITTPSAPSIINPIYSPGDIIGADINDGSQCIILEYDRGSDKYKNRFIWKINDDWVYIAENDTSTVEDTWDNREFLEEYYPTKMAHVESISEILDFDEYRSFKLKEALDAIPKSKKRNPILSVSTLEKELQWLRFDDYFEEHYEEDECDCSELSAYMEWWLESHGINTYLVVGNITSHPEIREGMYIYEEKEGGRHAWVVAELKGESVLIESTEAKVISDKFKPYYIEDMRFEDLQALLIYYHEEGYDIQSVLSEYDWWEDLPNKFIYH